MLKMLKTLKTLHTIKTLQTAKTLEALETLKMHKTPEMWKPLDTMKTLDTVETFETLNTFETFETLKTLNTLKKLKTLKTLKKLENIRIYYLRCAQTGGIFVLNCGLNNYQKLHLSLLQISQYPALLLLLSISQKKLDTTHGKTNQQHRPYMMWTSIHKAFHICTAWCTKDPQES